MNDQNEPQEMLLEDERLGKQVYDYLIEIGGGIDDVSMLPNLLKITPEQLAIGLKWCEQQNLVQLYIY